MNFTWYMALALATATATAAAAPTDRGEAWRLLNAAEFAPLDAGFNDAQRRYEADYKSVPDAERTLARAFRVFFFADESTGIHYDAWVKAHPKSYAASLARGEYLTALAWKRRGTGFAHSISPEQWGATYNVAMAAQAELTRSLTLTARPVLTYEFLIELSMMMGGSDTADLFAQARTLDPQAYYAARAYMNALRPQWTGSIEAMRAFAAAFRKQNPPAWKANCIDAQIADLESSVEINREHADRLAAMTRAIELCPQASRFDARGYLYWERKQFDLAEKDYRNALQQDSGDQWARASLGMLLVQTANAEEGVALCREAADRLERSAFQCMAYAHKMGRGVPKDASEVVRWLERSAGAGQSAGMSDLAGYYWRGEGVPQNKGRAVELWRKAAAQGYQPAKAKLQELGVGLQ